MAAGCFPCVNRAPPPSSPPTRSTEARPSLSRLQSPFVSPNQAGTL
jgi:hypothetical protein